jgi:hypothetical protein
MVRLNIYGTCGTANVHTDGTINTDPQDGFLGTPALQQEFGQG